MPPAKMTDVMTNMISIMSTHRIKVKERRCPSRVVYLYLADNGNGSVGRRQRGTNTLVMISSTTVSSAKMLSISPHHLLCKAIVGILDHPKLRGTSCTGNLAGGMDA
jgi:hypothetical protein